MVAGRSKAKQIVIVGPTASGKSDLAMRLAKEFNGEIIAADSRTVYKGMDIGTAKPTEADQAAVKHWGLDLVEPGERFTAADFQKYAETAIKDIQQRGKLPIVVGGTGLYLDALLFDFGFAGPADEKLRAELEKLSTEELQRRINDNDISMPENQKNRRHLIRAIERGGQAGTRSDQLPTNILLIGLLPPDDVLRERIDRRAAAMFDGGVVQETEQLAKKYGREKLLSTAGIVYKICLDLLDKDIDRDRAIELFNTADWQYARRQKTWFKRNPHIKWFDNPEDAYLFIAKQGEYNHS